MKKRALIWDETARYLAGEMSTKEEIAFREKMGHNDANDELKKMEKSWKYFSDMNPGEGSDTSRAWDGLYNRLEKDGLIGEQGKSRSLRHMQPLMRWAAVVLLILAVGIPSAWFGLQKNTGPEAKSSFMAEEGVQTVDLPDGSRVFLNKGATLTCPEEFRHNRSVNLKGEAFFEVMSDPVNPFTVRSGKVVVSVLGTSFNVKEGQKTEEEVQVFVESGKVRMGMEHSEEFITLLPGDLGQVRQGRLTASPQMDPNYISWKTKDFKFVDEELIKVLKELEESYHVEILADDALLADKKITSTYREQSIDAILETIGTAFGLNVSKKEDRYYLNL